MAIRRRHLDPKRGMFAGLLVGPESYRGDRTPSIPETQ